MSQNRIYSLVRALSWMSFIMSPIAISLAMMDYAAHNGGPGIGLEGAGRPGSSTTPLIMIAFVGIVGGFVARMMLPAPRGSMARVAGILVLCFIASMVASRPVFHWKWKADCDHDVALACWALAQIAPPADETGHSLSRKACELGQPDACKHLSEGGPEDKAMACTERNTACAKSPSVWPDATCKELDGPCGAL